MCIDIDDAKKIAQNTLAELEVSIGEPLAFSESEPKCVDGEWQFHYNTKEAIETGNPLAGLAGNGPLCVDGDGNVRQAGSA